MVRSLTTGPVNAPGNLFSGTEPEADLNFADKHKSDKYFLLAFGLLNILAFTLLLCGLSFLAGLTISKWQFPAGCVLALLANYYTVKFFIAEKTNRFFMKSSGVIIGLLTGLLLFAGSLYDISYDGQWYHQEIVYWLQHGFNPVYQDLAPPSDEVLDNYRPIPHVARPDKIPVNLKFLDINHFSKGAEIIETAIYQDTGRIETGKVMNGILLLASFFLCLSLFYKIGRFNIWKKWLFAFLFAFNPITVAQLPTFCVDGNMACFFLCIVAASCLLFFEINYYYLFLLGSLIIVAVNIKFTGPVFTAMYCTGYLVLLLAYKKVENFKKVLITGIISAFIGVVVCGFNPYITNLVKDHNVFYGLKQTSAEIQSITPPLFKKYSNFQNFFISIAAHQGWANATPKIPFTLNKEDILETRDSEQELSGFGPFFSGALLITYILLLYVIVLSGKTKVFAQAMAVFFIILSTILIMPNSWWARYVPQFWLLPIIILCLGEFISFRGHRLIKGILQLSLGLNIAWALLGIVYNVMSTDLIDYQLQQVKKLNKPVLLEYTSYKSFRSNQLRFLEAGIPVTEKQITGGYIYSIPGSSTKFETSAPLPKLPKSFLLKLNNKLHGREL